MISKVKLPFCALTVKRERFFLFVIILEIIFNLPLVIGIIPSIIALVLVFSEKSYNHSYFSFYKYYLLVVSVLDVFILMMATGHYIQKFIIIFSEDDSEMFSDIHIYILLLISFIFYIWKVMLAKTFFEEINDFLNTDEDSKNLQITISNENFEKKVTKEKDVSKLSIIEEDNEEKKKVDVVTEEKDKDKDKVEVEEEKKKVVLMD